jgi:hypothetical protein
MIALGDIPDRTFPDQAFCDWYAEEWEPYMLWMLDRIWAQSAALVIWFLLRRVLRVSEARAVSVVWRLQGKPGL